MANEFDIRALGRWYGKAMVIPHFADYAGPLMESWERRIEEGNRKGVLAGIDGNGAPMIPVTYRPIRPGVKLTVAQRLGQHPRRMRGDYFGGISGNLSSAEYRLLDGPPLAPRRQFSRVITNLVTSHGRDPGNINRWFAQGAWLDVVSRKGFHFLPVHFNGLPLGRNGPSIRRDLRPIRPETHDLMIGDMHAWAKLTIRERSHAA